MSRSSKIVCKFFLLLLFLCLACFSAFAEEIKELSVWSPNTEDTEFLYATEGDEQESVQVRVSRIASTKLWDPMLPDVFGGNKIKLRDKESDTVAKLNSSPNLFKAAEPVRWTENISHSADDKKKSYHYSLHSYILKNNPKLCIILFFSGDGNGLEQFYLVRREVPFSAGEDFFLYPNVYYPNDCTINNWKSDIEDWNALSEYERYFCMLSAPLVANHPQKMFSVNPEPLVGNTESKTYSQAVLERDWSCSSRADLLELIDGFRNESGFSPMYEGFLKLLAKYPKKTPDDISAMECLTIHDTACLFYVKQMEKKLGEHGMLAWDNGRILGVMRWGIAAGWLSEQEAMQYARPLIDELLDSYASWEDYLAHYTIGRGLFALSRRHDIQEYEHDELLNSLNYARSYETVDTKHQLSFHGTKFPAKNQKGNPVLTYNDAWYKPAADAKAWEEVYFLSTKVINSISQNDERKMLSFCAKKSNIPCAASLAVILREAKGLGSRELIRYYDSANPAFDKVVPEKRDYNTGSKIYTTFYTVYFYRSLAINDFDRMYKALQKLDDENTIDESMCISYSLYYYTKMKTEKDRAKIDVYEKKIIGFFSRILADGRPIGENELKQIYAWLEENLKGVLSKF